MRLTTRPWVGRTAAAAVQGAGVTGSGPAQAHTDGAIHDAEERDPTRVPSSPWGPLRYGAYRSLWIAVLVSNIGTWMHTVGAQWVLVEDPRTAALVPLVQTATTLPFALLSLPGGVLADSFDKRRLLLVMQGFQVSVALALTVLTAFGALRPWLLLLLTFGLGAGAALTGPAYHSLVPALVPRDQIPQAAGLSAVSMNIARSLGPAVGGLVIAQTGPAVVFGLNALTFLVFFGVLLRWRALAPEPLSTRERFGHALRGGARYVRHSPSLRRLLIQASFFGVPAIAVWSLLPLVAKRHLDLGSSGYGVLMAAIGTGAVIGALLLPRMRLRLDTTWMMAVGAGMYVPATAGVGLIRSLPVVMLLLVVVGAGWIMMFNTGHVSAQFYLPGWVRGRGLAIYQMVMFGSQAVGAAVWALVAEIAGLVAAHLVAAVMMALAVLAVLLRPLTETSSVDRTPVTSGPRPELALRPDDDDGPVLLSLTYKVAAEHHAAFLEAMQAVRRSRLRTGAVSWQLFQAGESPDIFIEQYVVLTWGDHLRQRALRLTASDEAVEERARRLAVADPVRQHLFTSDGRTRPSSLITGPDASGEAV
jgi:MFS family permease